MNAMLSKLLNLIPLCAATMAVATVPALLPPLPPEVANAPDGQWRVFEIDLVDGQGAPCCITGEWKGGRPRSQACDLDDDGWNIDGDRPAPPGERLKVFLRRDRNEASGVSRVRAFGSSCALTNEAAAVPTFVLDAAPATDLLAGLARQDSKKVSGTAIATLAMQDGNRAGQALEALTAPAEVKRVRRDATFWLTQTRGAQGFAAVQRLLARHDEERSVRRHAVFALSQSDEAGRDQALIGLSRDDADAEIRGEALFWLAQVSPAAAEPVLVATARGGENRKTIEKAIFGLSQLPANRAVPALSALATDRNLPRETRKQALFWLSQTDAEAALPEMDRLLGVER
jgi:hypothetical protein